jgi:hypothetical protein
MSAAFTYSRTLAGSNIIIPEDARRLMRMPREDPARSPERESPYSCIEAKAAATD